MGSPLQQRKECVQDSHTHLPGGIRGTHKTTNQKDSFKWLASNHTWGVRGELPEGGEYTWYQKGKESVWGKKKKYISEGRRYKQYDEINNRKGETEIVSKNQISFLYKSLNLRAWLVFCVFEVKFCGKKIEDENFGTGTKSLKYGLELVQAKKLSDLHVKLSSYGILFILHSIIFKYEIK